MPEPWTGDVVREMHNNGITYEALAAEIGVSKAYISMLLNSRRTPAGAKERLTDAVNRLAERKTAPTA